MEGLFSALLLGPECARNMIDDRLLSFNEIGSYLGVKRDTVYKWIAEKQMPAHRLGRLWKFRKEEVDAWIESGSAADSAMRYSRSGKD